MDVHKTSQASPTSKQGPDIAPAPAHVRWVNLPCAAINGLMMTGAGVGGWALTHRYNAYGLGSGLGALVMNVALVTYLVYKYKKQERYVQIESNFQNRVQALDHVVHGEEEVVLKLEEDEQTLETDVHSLQVIQEQLEFVSERVEHQIPAIAQLESQIAVEEAGIHKSADAIQAEMAQLNTEISEMKTERLHFSQENERLKKEMAAMHQENLRLKQNTQTFDHQLVHMDQQNQKTLARMEKQLVETEKLENQVIQEYHHQSEEQASQQREFETLVEQSRAATHALEQINEKIALATSHLKELEERAEKRRLEHEQEQKTRLVALEAIKIDMQLASQELERRQSLINDESALALRLEKSVASIKAAFVEMQSQETTV